MASAYKCDLGSQQLYVANPDDSLTTVTLSAASAGQQQQSSHGFSTGRWTQAPVLYTFGSGAVSGPQGMIILIKAAQTFYIHCQHGQVQISQGDSPAANIAEVISRSQPIAMEPIAHMPEATLPPMPSMPDMPPMSPMQMSTAASTSASTGTAANNNRPMNMRMGDMSMTMGSTTASAQSSASQASTDSLTQKAPQTAKRFCTQCGTPTAPEDKFCGACGHALSVKGSS